MKLLKIILVCVSVVMSCSIILSTAGCKSQSALGITIHDTLKVEKTIVVRDTVFKTIPTAVKTTLYIPCPEFKKKFKTSLNQFKNVKQRATMVGDSLQINCLCDTLAIKAQLINTYEKTYRSKIEATKETVRIKYVPDWVKFFAWCGAAFWLIVLIKSILKFYNPFKKIP